MKSYHSHSTRAASTHAIPIPKCKNKITKKSPFQLTIRSWNSLNSQCHEAHTKSQFSTLINMYDFTKILFLYCVSRSAQVAFTQLRVGFL